MKIIYDENDLKRILAKHHSYNNEPIKIGYQTQDVLAVKVCTDGVVVTLGKEVEEES